MPLYDFACPKCNKEMEIFQRMNEDNPECPEDGAPMEKVITKITARKGAGLWSQDFFDVKQMKDDD